MTLKNQLQIYLKHTGMTASTLAKKAGVPKQSLSGWLAGNNPRDMRQIKKIAEVLDISIDHLMFGEGVLTIEEKVTELEALLGDTWIGGLFEIRLRRVKR